MGLCAGYCNRSDSKNQSIKTRKRCCFCVPCGQKREHERTNEVRWKSINQSTTTCVRVKVSWVTECIDMANGLRYYRCNAILADLQQGQLLVGKGLLALLAVDADADRHGTFFPSVLLCVQIFTCMRQTNDCVAAFPTNIFRRHRHPGPHRGCGRARSFSEINLNICRLWMASKVEWYNFL